MPRFVKQLLGNPLARVVIAAMGQSAANLLERDFHIRGYPFIHILHERSPTIIPNDPVTWNPEIAGNLGTVRTPP